jgi:hypothetical protein
MITQYDMEAEAAAIRGQIVKVLTAWASRSKADLQEADWHHHPETSEDVMIVITRHRVCFRVTIRPMEFGAFEARRRELEEQKKKAVQEAE